MNDSIYLQESGDSMLLGGIICLAAMVLGVALCVIGEKLWRQARKKRAIEAHLAEHRSRVQRVREPWEGMPLDEQTQFWGPKIQNVSPEERVRLLGPKIQNVKQEPKP